MAEGEGRRRRRGVFYLCGRTALPTSYRPLLLSGDIDPPPLLLRALSSSVVHLGLLGGSLHLTPSIHVDGLRARHSYDKRLRDELAALVKAQGALALVSADSEGNGGAAELRAAHAALDAAAMIEAQTTDVLAAAAVGGGGGGWAGGGGG